MFRFAIAIRYALFGRDVKDLMKSSSASRLLSGDIVTSIFVLIVNIVGVEALSVSICCFI